MTLEALESASTAEERFLRASEKFWHPVVRSVDLPPGTMRSVTVLSKSIVVWRDADGVLAAVDGVCAHRGAALADGRLTSSGCIRCPYHGWEYGSDGRCTHVPQAPGAPIPKRARVRSYGCAEAADLIWLWLGDEDPVSFPIVPESSRDGWTWFVAPSFTWKANALREIENYCDMAHFSILHEGTFGDTSRPEVGPYKVSVSDDGKELEWEFDYGMVDRRTDPWSIVPTHWLYRIRAPFGCCIELRDPSTNSLRRVFVNFAVPTSLDRTQIFYGTMFREDSSATEVDDSFAFSMAIFEEDRAVVERQRPVMLSVDSSVDLTATFDRYSVAYRRVLAQLGF